MRAAARRQILWAIIALGVAAAIFAGWAGLRWWNADRDSSLELAKTRDQVLIAADSHIATLQTLDYRDVEGGLEAWLAVTTDQFHDELAKVGEQDKQNLAKAAMVTEGRVADAAVVDLSAGGREATVIAAVETTLEPREGEITVKRQRYTADLVKVKGEWKVAGLEQVEVVTP